MKSILFLLCCLLSSAIFCQDIGKYQVDISVTISDPTTNHSSGCPNFYSIRFFYSDGTSDVVAEAGLGGLAGSSSANFTHIDSFSTTKKFIRFEIEAERSWSRLIGGCKSRGTKEKRSYDAPKDYTNCFSYTYSGIIPRWASVLTMKISPKSTTIKSLGDPLSKDTAKNFIPTDDNISLVATKGFSKTFTAPFAAEKEPIYTGLPLPTNVDSIYGWMYHTGEMKLWKPWPWFPGTYIPVWNDFPYYLNYRDSVSISARDLVGNGVDTLIGKPIKIRLAYNCGTSNTITLTCLQSAPHINNVIPIPNKCFGDNTAAVKIQFDRSLKTNETLNIFLRDTAANQYSVLDAKLDASNSFTWENKLPPGKYKVSLIGKYPNAATVTYTSGARHFYDVEIKSPAKLTFTAVKQNDVRCYGGNDGAIKLTATGGVGNYKVGYKKSTDTGYVWQNFSTATTHTITGLDTGNYTIKIRDANDCFEKDMMNKEAVRTATINQPAEPVKIDNAVVKDPLGYGRTDGTIKVIIKGGTKKTDGSYNITWKKIDGTILNTVSNTNLGTTYQSELQNIGKGKYILNVTDSNFTIAASGATQGCILIDTFNVNEPPPLIVNIDKETIILCKGDANGAIVAHASGGVPFTTGTTVPYKYQWFKQEATDIDLAKTDSLATNLKAGNYIVKITDKNGIEKISDVFTLTEPDSLKIQFTTSVTACIGKGSITATISGGTAPYHIEWTTADTTLTINNKDAGNYVALVKDAHGCETQSTIKLQIPNAITIDNAITQNPSYYNSNDGQIQLTISGGNPPYTYSWSNGATTKDLQSLYAGTYSVAITDASGCTQTQNYTLQNPPRIIHTGGSSLPNGITTKTLCNGQRLDIDATINDNAATYRWNGDNGFSANTAKVTLTNIGKYWITVTDSRGVNASDTLIIKQSNANINASFVVTTQAFKGKKVTFVNISYPAPERISWLIPNDTKIETIQNNQNVAELIFKDTGTYTINMKAFVGECEQMITKKVIVIEGQQFDDIGAVQNPYVKEFTIAPNPNTGQFNVIIKLQEQGKIRLRMMNTSNSAMVDDRALSGSSQYTIPYTINAAAGVYILLLETAKGNQMQKIIIN